MSSIHTVVAAALTLALSGCDGTIFGPTTSNTRTPVGPGSTGGAGGFGSYAPGGGTDPGTGGAGGGTVAPVACGAPPTARVWRLSHAQYDRAVGALLGTAQKLGANFELEASGSGFTNGADTAYVSDTLARQYFDAAEALAAEAIATPAKLLPCSSGNPGDVACVQLFIEQFGRRMFRAPLSAAQQTLYFSLYQKGTTPTLGVQMVLEAMLQSPYFLYRQELGVAGASGAAVALTQHELASALAFLVWDNTPDDALLDKADLGQLGTADQVQAELTRLLADPQAHSYVWRFIEQDFEFNKIPNLDKDVATFPDFTATLPADLLAEGEAFVDEVTWNGQGTLRELLTADYSMLNQRLAPLYGVTGVTGSAFHKVSLPTGQRSGLLTHAGLLAVHGDQRSGSPVQRGLFVRSGLLCQQMPAPPVNVADTLEPPGPVHTTRDRYAAHLQNASCVGCHQLMDPIGFGFEGFDGLGRWRDHENGVPVDTSGSFVATRDIDGAFVGPLQVGQKLAGSGEVADCVATSYWRFAMGRVETADDVCSLAAMRTTFQSSGTKLSQLLHSLVATPGFNQRIKL